MNKTHLKLLQLLSRSEKISGEKLGVELGVSRAAVWKAVKCVNEKYQLTIESIPQKGYVLEKGICLLDKKKIQTDMASLEVLIEVDSTNDYLLNRLRELTDSFAVVLAELQTKGRGRRGKHWVSPFGANIYCSMLFRLNKEPSQLMGLSCVVAIAVVEALIQYGVPAEKLKSKWPNDIYYDEKKLVGILIDLVAEANAGCALVVGVGINTLTPDNVDQPVIGLDAILKKLTDRNHLASLLIQELKKQVLQFNHQSFSYFLNRWHELDYCLNQPVHVLQGDKIVAGVAKGVSDKGELLVDVNGSIQTFLSGEVSLRPARQFL